MHAADHNLLVKPLADEAATLAFGAELAHALTPGLVVFLEGDLGAGKTTLVRGLLRGLGYPGKVKSPTYSLVESHVISGLNFYHFDFYRLNQPEEYLEAGLDEYFSGVGICLVEWPDKAAPYLPQPDLRLDLAVAGDGRELRLAACSPRGQSCLTSLDSHAATSSSSPPPA